MTRGRPPSIRRSRPLNVHLDEELLTRVDILLFSELESRVPKGAYQKLFNSLLTQWLDQRELDLAPYLGSLPGEHLVLGHAETLAALNQHLTGR
jgi:hypothetical protein